MNVLKVDNTDLYYVYAAVVSVVATMLFVLMSPGFVYRGSGKSSKYVSRPRILVHALVFMLVIAAAALLLAFAFKRMHQKADDNKLASTMAVLHSGPTMTVGGGGAAGRTGNFLPGRVYSYDRSCPTMPFGFSLGMSNMNGYGEFTGLAEP